MFVYANLLSLVRKSPGRLPTKPSLSIGVTPSLRNCGDYWVYTVQSDYLNKRLFYRVFL